MSLTLKQSGSSFCFWREPDSGEPGPKDRLDGRERSAGLRAIQ